MWERVKDWWGATRVLSRDWIAEDGGGECRMPAACLLSAMAGSCIY